ncbi:F-box protein PP2-A13-like [Magnolia sinica]|uniref:F-box protein PP2-A13-like n=1 Tax=Magnolia sinica TaxID=86752 RepID=UPI00265A8550|nr:F-box protein PP2-A13-like [Magnolia sinica]
MGAGISTFSPPQSSEGCSSSRLKTGLDDIPESCIASVLVHLSPTEICSLARLSRSFRGAASADFVWELKLPKNYRYLVQKLFDEIPADLSKKEIYARLCRPNLFDGGTKVAWLEKSTGGICMSISAKSLSITGIDDRRYWNFVQTEESRFHTVAYLHQIWWFEVDGEVEFHFPAGTYSLLFRLHLGRASKRLGRRVCNPEHVHGWDIKPVRFQLSTSDGQQALSQCYLDDPGNWVHYHVGDFVVENSDTPTKVKFSMTQIDCTHTKGGLCLDSVLIYPSVFREKGKILSQGCLCSIGG